jgi:hypothetical protein
MSSNYSSPVDLLARLPANTGATVAVTDSYEKLGTEFLHHAIKGNMRLNGWRVYGF